MLCTAEHCTLKSRKPKLCGDITETLDNSSYGKLLYFEQHIQLKTGNKFNRKYARTELIVCCMLKVLLNLHIFQLLNINCSEPCLGPLSKV